MNKLELRILELLSTGLKQIEIPPKLRKEGFEINSLATVEKTLKKVKSDYGAKSNFHLAVILTKKGII
ncbi:hypothetical protein [Tenacibaculum sp. MAR_2009_124]|uniref:hypothetical protein n=1 Tax=Tenacibaculum sp. MAR_2009_124 TaxID=1250059 RepID=UPI000B853799|nr:hypothetical protein [Tenacibaculum sp. MAR_2009_124]